MFRPLEAIVRSRFGYPGGVVKFKVANGTGTPTETCSRVIKVRT